MILTIQKANAFALRLGVQHPEPGVSYQENPCLIKNGNAWYNPLTGEAIYIKDAEKETKRLINRWFYVPKGFDIKAAAHTVRQRTKSDTQVIGWAAKRSYVVFTTTACNAACTYCFEKGMKVLSMSEKTAHDIAEYIRKTAHKDGITVKWFGGEPLCNMKPIDIICKHLTDSGVKFSSDITTNGDFLDMVTDEQLKLWRLKGVQVTLDDVGENYGKWKGLDGKAYDRLRRSLVRLSDMGIYITVRIHYHPTEGLQPCYRVVDGLKDIKHLGMYARIIYQAESDAEYNNLLTLEEYMLKCGKYRYQFPKRGGGVHCMGDNQRIACITPDGHLSPCEHYAFGEVYGTIYDRKFDREMLTEWQVKEKHICDCEGCKLYPVCEKLILCPAEGDCTKGYKYYQIETIKRALRENAKEDSLRHKLQGATENELKQICGVC